jgi:hypothetical protein
MERPPGFFFLHHDTEHRLLICTVYNYALSPGSVSQHCGTEGHSNTSVAARRDVQAWAETLNIHTHDTWDYQQVLPQPIPFLELQSGAIVCQYESCHYVCMQDSTFKKHKHGTITPSCTRNNKAHQVFGRRKLVYTLVLDIFPPTCAPSDAIKKALDLFRTKQHHVTKQFNVVTEKAQAATPWLERTQFPVYLDGLTTQEISRLLADPQATDDRMQCVCDAFHAMVATSFAHARSIPHILLKFLSAHNATLPDKPMLLSQTRPTIERYTALGWRLFRAIIRRPEVLSPTMLAQHSRLLAALDAHISGSEIPELLQFCITVLEEKTWDVQHRPCLLYGVALFSYNTAHNVYYQASDISPTLAAFK